MREALFESVEGLWRQDGRRPVEGVVGVLYCRKGCGKGSQPALNNGCSLASKRDCDSRRPEIGE